MADNAPRFRYAFNDQQNLRIQDWVKRARLVGRGVELEKALKIVDYRLKYEADTWGARFEYLPTLQLERRRGKHDMLTVHYGVNHPSSNVFVDEFHLNKDFWESIHE